MLLFSTVLSINDTMSKDDFIHAIVPRHVETVVRLSRHDTAPLRDPGRVPTE